VKITRYLSLLHEIAFNQLVHTMIKTRIQLTKQCIVICVSLLSVNAYGWGERGHDVVTRVAVQNLKFLSGNNAAVVAPFAQRDHMLAHLSNVPDIVWRAPYMSALDRDANYHTHFINMEKVYEGVSVWSDVPADFTVYQRDAKNKNHTAIEVGTVPWRILQLYQKLVTAFKQVNDAGDDAAFEKTVNDALFAAGTMSHFVADLANPHHTTTNYDGQLTGQKGLHTYFESDVVAELSLDLAYKVHGSVKRTWLTAYNDEQRAAVLSDPQKLVWALLANSHRSLPTLLALDEKHSLIEKVADPEQTPPRKAPAKVAKQYESFIVQRLAVGASVLSRLWLLAWVEAGSPDLSDFKSYEYPVKPDFIDPSFIDSKPGKKVLSDWRMPDADNVLIMELDSGRVVMELAPKFAPQHVDNIRLLTRQGYFDDLAIIRSQENYVVQWGDPAFETDNAKSLGGAKEKLKVEFFRDSDEVGFVPIDSRDAYTDFVGFTDGFPTASDGKQAWLAHCYGMVGVSRDVDDDSGNGAGLYVVTGHAPRHLDRNVTLVGRVISGMEHLTTLPRGTGALGFYESHSEHVRIQSIKLASRMPEGTLDLQVMRTDSAAFDQHVKARTTREEEWFLEPTGRIELCNVAVPTRKSGTE